jgi:hypothetical protein
MLTTGAGFAEVSGVRESKWNCRSNSSQSAAFSFMESAADQGDYPHRFRGESSKYLPQIGLVDALLRLNGHGPSR